MAVTMMGMAEERRADSTQSFMTFLERHSAPVSTSENRQPCEERGERRADELEDLRNGRVREHGVDARVQEDEHQRQDDGGKRGSHRGEGLVLRGFGGLDVFVLRGHGLLQGEAVQPGGEDGGDRNEDAPHDGVAERQVEQRGGRPRGRGSAAPARR